MFPPVIKTEMPASRKYLLDSEVSNSSKNYWGRVGMGGGGGISKSYLVSVIFSCTTAKKEIMNFLPSVFSFTFLCKYFLC